MFSICVLKDGTLLTGGKDRKIVHWSTGYKKLGQEHEVRDYSEADRYSYLFFSPSSSYTIRTHPGKPGKYCNFIIRFPGLEYTGIPSKVLENLEYEPIFGAFFLPC